MQKIFAEFFGACPENVFLFSKGRVGLYAVLKALGLGRGDEIIVPGYTCMVVPSAARFLDVTSRYVDIDNQTYNLNPRLLDRLFNAATKALIVQHTYGIPAPMDEIMQWAADRGVVVIEDCCHAFGSLYKGRLCGTFGAAAFFSGQWNKPFSTGLGGMLLVNDEDLLQELNSIHRNADDVVFYENFRLKAQLLAYKSMVTPRTNALITGLYRFLSKKGITSGSSSPEELVGTMPQGYLKKMAPCQIAEGVVRLGCIGSNLAARRKNTAIYDSGLKKTQFRHLELSGDTDCVVLRYPVRVGNKSEVLKIASRKSLEIGSWFEVPLHPLGTDMASFGYNEGLCPESEKAAREVINLPTHAQITEEEAQRIIGFLQEFAVPA